MRKYINRIAGWICAGIAALAIGWDVREHLRCDIMQRGAVEYIAGRQETFFTIAGHLAERAGIPQKTSAIYLYLCKENEGIAKATPPLQSIPPPGKRIKVPYLNLK